MPNYTTLATTLALAVLTGCTAHPLPKEDKDTWTSYFNKDSTRIGFKDKNGVIKTEAKFGSPTGDAYPLKFDDIIALGEGKGEEVDGKWDWHSYYFTKSGKIFGRDSLYFTDEGAYDCESEGFIRFMRVEEKDNNVHYKYAGMFNRNGKVVAPAKYNYLSRVRNGMMIALEGAKKECLDRDCEHYKFVGGRDMLIDTLGNILVDNFSSDGMRYLNFYSLQKTANPHADTIRESFLATDGSYYSFINYEKEFKQWLQNDLLVNLTPEKLLDASFETIVWQEWPKASEIYERQSLITSNFEILKNGLLGEQYNWYYIMSKPLSTFDGIRFEKYFDICDDFNEKYPVMSITRKNKDEAERRNKYSFLRSDIGYKLIDVFIREP